MMKAAMKKTTYEPDYIQRVLGDVKRIVVKVGTRVIDNEKTSFNRPVIESLVHDICELKRNGTEVLLVSSGAVGAGMRELNVSQRPQSIHLRQAYAAVGQSRLMNMYSEIFNQYGVKTAQVLLTRADLDRRASYLNAKEALRHLLTIGVVPIINENDTVSIDELRFGDNDNLASLVAGKMDAGLLILLTTVDGLFRKFDRKRKQGELVEIVDDRFDDYLKWVDQKVDSFSMGGMRSKLEAARNAGSKGVLSVIANGLKNGILLDLFSGKAKATWMLPTRKRMAAWKYYLAFAKQPCEGSIRVDEGAVQALKERGKSLLASGVQEVHGRFQAKDLIRIETLDGEEFARGLVDYHSRDLRKILGCKTQEVEKILPNRKGTVVHRNNLVLL